MTKLFRKFIDSLSSLSTEDKETIHLCRLSNHRKPIDVVLIYYASRPQTKCILFRKGKRPLLELRLDDEKKDLQDLCNAIKSNESEVSNLKNPLGFLDRILLKVLGRKILSCSVPICISKNEINETMYTIRTKNEYFIVKLAGWLTNSVMILHKRLSYSSSGSFPLIRKRKKINYFWVKLLKNDIMLLKQSINQLLIKKSID